jgi:hypothetical protein
MKSHFSIGRQHGQPASRADLAANAARPSASNLAATQLGISNPMLQPSSNLMPALPEIFLAIGAMVMLMLGVSAKQQHQSIAGLAASACSSCAGSGAVGTGRRSSDG